MDGPDSTSDHTDPDPAPPIRVADLGGSHNGGELPPEHRPDAAGNNDPPKESFWKRWNRHPMPDRVMATFTGVVAICAALQIWILIGGSGQTDKLISAANVNACAARQIAAASDRNAKAAEDFAKSAGLINSNVNEAVGKLQLQAKNGESQIKLSADQFQASQRPWIELQADNPKILIGNHPEIFFYLMAADFKASNVGNSIARNVVYKSFLTTKKFLTGKECEFPASGGTVIFPKEEFWGKAEVIEQAPSFHPSDPSAPNVVFIQCLAYTSPLDKGIVHHTQKSYSVNELDKWGNPFNRRQATGNDFVPVAINLIPEDTKAD